MVHVHVDGMEALDWNEEKHLELLYPTLRGHHSTKEVMRCIEIALLYVQEDVSERPTMARIVHILNNYSLTLAAPLTPSTFSLRNIEQNPTSLQHELCRGIY